jgi:hypothetical protein
VGIATVAADCVCEGLSCWLCQTGLRRTKNRFSLVSLPRWWRCSVALCVVSISLFPASFVCNASCACSSSPEYLRLRYVLELDLVSAHLCVKGNQLHRRRRRQNQPATRDYRPTLIISPCGERLCVSMRIWIPRLALALGWPQSRPCAYAPGFESRCAQRRLSSFRTRSRPWAAFVLGFWWFLLYDVHV